MTNNAKELHGSAIQSGFQYNLIPEDIQTMKMLSSNEENYLLGHDTM
jgi:hypothetical protein